MKIGDYFIKQSLGVVFRSVYVIKEGGGKEGWGTVADKRKGMGLSK